MLLQAGAITVGSMIFLRESYPYTILGRKTKRLRKETGNDKLRSALDTGRSPKDFFSLAIVRPSKMLFCSPIVFLLSLHVAIMYGYLYLVFTAMPTLFEEQYSFSTGSVGLTYIGLGVGSLLGLVLVGMTSDRLVTYLAVKNGSEPKPEYRLPPVMVASILAPAGLFWYGWTAETNQHWMLPIVGVGFFGCGLVVAFVSAI